MEKIYSEIGFQNEVINGTGKTYFISGDISMEFNNVDGKSNGPYKTYHYNGYLRKKELPRMGILMVSGGHITMMGL